ncbi:unnamed protein product [Ambrosiozyma monospora]|uniref:Unnamed protein product n=1 Tax=Ambrosiozyma monospora TaxID=43982 RepID=A0ACB5T1G5_AMBMO|nr:unnamed protein product [Ambrosiozyma monospora]
MLAGSTTRILFAIRPTTTTTTTKMFTLATRSITSSKKRETVLIDDNVSLYQNAPPPLPFNSPLKHDGSTITTTRILNDEEGIIDVDNRSKLVGSTIYNHIKSIDLETCHEDALDPFYVCDLSKLNHLLQLWHTKLSRVEPLYAIKCNKNPILLSKMVSLGLGFDCASKNEIEMILKLGVHPNKIIYANPCKSIPYIRYAQENEINLTTVDNLDEVYKLQKYHSKCGILIRIQTFDQNSTCPLSVKFGADKKYAIELISKCKELGLNLKGLAFHVGSGCNDLNTIRLAVEDSRYLFDVAELQFGYKFDTLDIGGGFSESTFIPVAETMNHWLNLKFPHAEFGNLKIVSELGRFLSSSLFTLVANITSKRGGSFKERLYLNDGLYGNLNCVLFDHQVLTPKVATSKGVFKYFETCGNLNSGITADESNDDKLANKEYSIWGPTCDGLDCISPNCKLSHEVDIGDWIYFENVGAYTSAASTNFNGFDVVNTKCLYID